jgi:hypothetical protein
MDKVVTIESEAIDYLEILINSIKEINIKNLKVEDWYKITNKGIDLGIVICKKRDDVFKMMVYNNVVTICFEYKEKYIFLWDYEVDIKDLKYYLKLLLQADSIDSIHYIESLMRHKVKVGDIIKFEDGTKAKISSYPEDKFHNLRYKKYKKNNELGIKNYILYGGVKFEILKSK